MRCTPKPMEPLNYQTPPPRSGNWTLIWIISLVTASILLGAFLWMFSSASAPPPVATLSPKPPIVIPAPGIAPNIALPSDNQAIAAVTKTLDDLLAGKLNADPTFAPIARKVSAFQSWSITSITQQDQSTSRTFVGTLNSGNSVANFSIQMVKQKDGSWQVAIFSGPDR